MSYQPPKPRPNERAPSPPPPPSVHTSVSGSSAASTGAEKADAKGVFLEFLSDHEIDVGTPIASSSSSSLEQVVEELFDELDERLLRIIAEKALANRDAIKKEDAFGPWAQIIDAVRETTIKRRERAGAIFERLVNIGKDGDLKQIQIFIGQLFAAGQLDMLLEDLVDDALSSCEKQGNDEYAAMFRYFTECITRAKESMGKGNGGKATSTKSIPPKKEQTPAPPQPPPIAIDSPEEQRELMKAGVRLQLLLKECNKDVATLKTKAESECKNGKIDKYFLKVLDDNISACKQAHYENKAKLLTYLKSIIENALKTSDENDDGNTSSSDASTSHHAPKFIGQAAGVVEDPAAVSPDTFIAKESEKSLAGLSKAKAKDVSKANKKKKDTLAESLSKHLDKNGWAVCDGFLSPDLVRRVRIEAELFKDFYEESEIWVGKQADIGAHLSVPSVRGDKVLWMCGAHRGMAPEGVTRHVKTKGELEPCKLKVKAHAPTRKFSALKELVSACDGLIDDMKLKIESLAGIYERSDAMLAVYPGGGSRFARHIDNTTGDGRRLTLLIYLNPDWTKEMGGALRLTTRLLARKVESSREGILEMEAVAAGIDEIGVEMIDEDSKGNASSSSSGGGTSFNSNPDSMFIDVYPNAGRLAMFYSAETAHEVLPTHGSRYAITIWYYDYKERDEAIKDSTKSGRAQEMSQTTVEDQKDAKAFIAELMGGDEVGEDGGNPTQEELVALAKRVSQLSDAALGIVSSITGAPSVQSFREGFKMLVPEDLRSMRQLFRRMGLND